MADMMIVLIKYSHHQSDEISLKSLKYLKELMSSIPNHESHSFHMSGIKHASSVIGIAIDQKV